MLGWNKMSNHQWKKYIEVNIYGKARKNNEEFIIIGEAKTRITNKAIIGFLKM